LKRLREVMAGPGGADERLQVLVRMIAANMVAEVCSVYMRRADEVLELIATEGLNPAAVHVTKLRVGEGLVGDIAAHARPLALAEAQGHPQFAYRPETGEEIYHSLLGAPILRGGKVAGVVVVQNRTRRQYTVEETEALEIIAMVLAELIGTPNFGTAAAPAAQAVERARQPYHAEGQPLAEGLALGVAVLHEPRIVVTKTIADDIPLEKRRLEQAIGALRSAVDDMLAGGDGAIVGESREILEAYKMFAHDSGWMVKLGEAVESGLTAEAAVQRVQAETRQRMNAITDPYLRERLADLEDLANRLLRHLAGVADRGGAADLPANAIVFARHMGPAELLDYRRPNLQGLVLEEGTAYSHVAILARALGLPVVGGLNDIVAEVDPGDTVVLDGDRGQLYLRPADNVREAFSQNLAMRQARQAKYAADRDQPAVTRDGQRIGLYLNAGLLMDVEQIALTGAEGIGLYRTELQFMVQSTFPKADAQAELYSRVLEQAGDATVVFRTLDVGGDKILPYLGEFDEENPAMGWRAIRIALDRPVLLRSQLRALLMAAAGRRLDVMFPMVADVSEFARARAILDDERTRLRGLGQEPPDPLLVGTMLEVPALAWQLPALLPLVDFVSVGSNDLMQFMFAADRTNPRLADRYDPLSPAVLKFLRWIVRQCDERSVPATLCGEMAGRPLEAMALIGLGFRRISMNAGAIGPVKEMVRSMEVAPLAAYIDQLCDSPERNLRLHLQNYARDRGVTV
jgi:phosphotransferase system, enzyme I, PtsP